MAVKMSEVAHCDKKNVVTCNQRTFQSAVVQKYTSGTTSSVGKNDYRDGKHQDSGIILLWLLNRQELRHRNGKEVLFGNMKT